MKAWDEDSVCGCRLLELIFFIEPAQDAPDKPEKKETLEEARTMTKLK